MSTTDLIQYLTWSVYLVIFVVVLLQAIAHPRRTNIDIALFFGILAFIIADSLLANLGLFTITPWLGVLNGILLLSLAYVLLRLVDDFTSVPRFFMRAMGVCLVLASAGLLLPRPAPIWVAIGQVAFFVGLQVYAARASIRTSRRASGVTKRLRVVALGSGLLGLTILAISLQPLGAIWGIIAQLGGLASGIAYFLGFAPPGLLRRAWQEPELRAFLGRAARLPRLPTTEAIIRDLEAGAATSVGAPNASLGLWNEETESLHFNIDGRPIDIRLTEDLPGTRAFVSQRAHFVPAVPRRYTVAPDEERHQNSLAVLVAPITAGDKRLGVLAVYATQAPIFADDDLELVQLLADQAAVILESRSLIDEAARVRAHEEATRLKDDFLSAAAHDLKTPLSTLVGRAQLMERRALRSPDAPADLASTRTIIAEAQRLRTLVLELLDASRAERGQLVGQRTMTDLTTLAREASKSQLLDRHHIVLDTNGPVMGLYDPNRIRQLIDNLIENAVKYSPEGGDIRPKVWAEDHNAQIDVSDQGIGIPTVDLPHIFDRFYRAKNVDDRRFAGMGLGLFICRAIVEQHNGSIWATSRPGMGTTFHVRLPITVAGDGEHA